MQKIAAPLSTVKREIHSLLASCARVKQRQKYTLLCLQATFFLAVLLSDVMENQPAAAFIAARSDNHAEVIEVK
ncbi:hypothetical protein LU631_19200 [Erwinia tracheiphila]|uniref:hypothetical protein n=1 Tax=Erwinia tracheiphila TaxID=65700 RepID=UPI00128BD367|nr:hypothetical protein [Erwinia tracheiphila]UIA86935.1 hypothetical protein LU631_19200 [Erwinia tracheiphila]UIA95290.1 hypothetical protein LU633_17650 [Erwinia tracheiphila]